MEAALIVLDGWGIAGDDGGRDAVGAAHTPVFDALSERCASGTLSVSGRRVGLPDGQMGNSEVGHLNIGAGRVVFQEYTRITDAIADGTIRENEVLADTFAGVTARDGVVHFLGLVSDGGVHADHRHLHALIEWAGDVGVEAVTHAFTDGRDTSPHGGAGYLAALERIVDEVGTGDVATVVGRYFAMDRDENWERTHRAYEAIVERTSLWTAESGVEAVEAAYDRGETDEFIEPTCIEGRPGLGPDDAVVWFNFRSDRARQLTRMLADLRPVWDPETDPPEVPVVTMTQYDETFDLPVAFAPTRPENTLGEVLADAGTTQLRIAESEKYPHVTYFLNGGREVEFDGEYRHIVPSPDVPTYDERPAMSAPAVTDTAIEVIEADDPDVLVLNYANPDMVGHTGDFDAAVAAVEAVDTQLGRLLETLEASGAHVIVTADHGNADDMGTPDDPHTAHTTNPVPFVYCAPDGTDGGRRIREGGTLADVAPTLLELVGVDQPVAMTGKSLLE